MSLHESKRSAYEEYEASLIRLALAELRREEADARVDVPDEEIVNKRDAAYGHAMRLIGVQLKRKRREHFWRETLPKVSRAAAVIVLIGAAGLATAIAAVGTVRARVLEFLMRTTPKYTELSLLENEALAFEVPADWEGKYFPSYVPEGYLTYSTDCVPGSCEILYLYRRYVLRVFRVW